MRRGGGSGVDINGDTGDGFKEVIFKITTSWNRSISPVNIPLNVDSVETFSGDGLEGSWHKTVSQLSFPFKRQTFWQEWFIPDWCPFIFIKGQGDPF